MTKSQRLLAIALTGGLLLSGFAFGRMTEAPKSNAAEEGNASVSQFTAPPTPAINAATNANQSFYLSDYKTGYSDGFGAAKNGSTSSLAATDRTGYNEGFKLGYADGFQQQASQETSPATVAARPAAFRSSQQQVVYQPSSTARRRSGNSKLKTVLTIAAPAAIGAGVGAMVGGKKGAGVGALLGGGGGAVYHLIKNRN